MIISIKFCDFIINNFINVNCFIIYFVISIIYSKFIAIIFSVINFFEIYQKNLGEKIGVHNVVILSFILQRFNPVRTQDRNQY